MSGETPTEVGQFEFGKNGRVVLSKSAKPITYYKTHWLTWTWVACAASDGKGCAALGRAKLSLDKAPPPLREPPEPPPEKKSGQERLYAVMDGIDHWLTKPMPSLLPPRAPKPPPAPPLSPESAAPEPAPADPVIPPFDIQQIPDVMDKLKLPVSARMMRHWFEGRANYSTTEKHVVAAIDQKGQPYAPDMIDQSIIKLDWVLGFPRAQKAHDELISTAIHAPNAAKEIKRNLLAFSECRADPFASFNGLTAIGHDIHRLHANFQFQLAQVDGRRIDKVVQWLAGDAGVAKAPDDLTGALGTFSFYAALGDVYMSHVTRMARIESIYVYVRDSYSFRDDDESISQYLGHWNPSGVFLAPLPAVGQRGAASWVSAPLVDIDKSIYDKGSIMYPVSNKSFRDWRAKYIRGGDFIVYTQPKRIRLAKDIKVSLR